jgi:hypothetical protein
LNRAAAFTGVGLVLALGAAGFGVYLWLTGRSAIAPIGVIALLAFLTLTLVGRMPLQRMNLAAPLAPERLEKLEPMIRAHLAQITALTVALFGWMELAAAFQWLRAYLWTCWVFVAAILLLLLTMINRVGRERAGEEPEPPWNP